MRAFGIDSSHWEPNQNWLNHANKIAFAYYKATDGIYGVDSEFEANRAGCKASFIPSAPYHWFKPDQSPITQANHFINVTMGYSRYIVDVEEPSANPQTYYWYWSRLKQLLDRVETLTAIKPAIYTSKGFWETHFGYRGAAVAYDLIVANYTYLNTPKIPTSWQTWKIWQFNTHFWLPGSNTELDANWFNGSWGDARIYFLGSPNVVNIEA